MRDPVVHDFNQQSAAIDAETAKEIFLESLREEIQADPEEKQRIALLYAEAHEEEFLDWAAEKKLDELTPVYTRGWRKPC